MNSGPVLIELVLPAVLTTLLLFVRKRCRFRTYIVAGLILVVISLGIWRRFPDVTTYNRAPLDAAGFAGFAFVPAFASMALICAIPPVAVWRFFQPVVAFVAAFYWFLRYSWIA